MRRHEKWERTRCPRAEGYASSAPGRRRTPPGGNKTSREEHADEAKQLRKQLALGSAARQP